MKKTNKITTAQEKLTEIKQLYDKGWFPDYYDLYRYLVGFPLPSKHPESPDKKYEPSSPYETRYFKGVEELRSHIERTTKIKPWDPTTKQGYVINNDSYWTYIEYRTDDTRSIFSLVKLYVPVKPAYVPHTARIVFDFLFERNRRFYFKVAHNERTDTICAWILREELNLVIEFLQTIVSVLEPAPFFCPEYKSIGITRELDSSFNEMIASTLFTYLPQVKQPTLAGYIAYLENCWFGVSEDYEADYDQHDRSIVLRSLKCIMFNECPVESTLYEIADFTCEKWRCIAFASNSNQITIASH